MKLIFPLLMLSFCSQAHGTDVIDALNRIDSFKKIETVTSPPKKQCHTRIKRMVKVSDGMRGHCRNKSDRRRYQSGGLYRVTPSNPTKVSDGSFNVDFKMTYLKCIKQNGRYKMVIQETPFQYSFDDFLPNLDSGIYIKSHITVQKKDVRLQAHRDGMYKPMSGLIQKDNNDYKTNIKIDLKKVLSKSDIRKIKRGEKVVIPIDLAQRGKSRRIINGKKVTGYRQFNGGAFRVFFEISNGNNGLELKIK